MTDDSTKTWGTPYVEIINQTDDGVQLYILEVLVLQKEEMEII